MPLGPDCIKILLDAENSKVEKTNKILQDRINNGEEITLRNKKTEQDIVELFGKDFDELELKLNVIGKKIDDTVPGSEPPVSYREDFINEQLGKEVQAQLDDIAELEISAQKLINFSENVERITKILEERDPTVSIFRDPLSILPGRKRKTYTPAQQYARALNSMLLNTNDVIGHVPLEILIKNKESNLLANFQKAVDRENIFNGKRFEDWLKDSVNESDMIDEFYLMNEKMTSNVAPVTKNKEAFRAAQLFFDNVTGATASELKLLGRATGYLNTARMKVRFDLNKVKNNFTREQFIDRMVGKNDTPGLMGRYFDHDGTDITADIASVVYDTILDGKLGWRKINDQINRTLQGYWGNQWKKYDGVKRLVFRDGAARRQAVEAFSYYETGGLEFMSSIQENGRELALTTFFGKDYEKTWNEIKKAFTKGSVVDGEYVRGPLGEDFAELAGGAGEEIDKKVVKSVFGFVSDRYINPYKGETSSFASAMSGLRNIQNIAKLGSASITSILDMPTFAFAARKLFGLDVDETIAGMFRVNKFRGTPAEQTYHRIMVGDAMQGMLNSIGNRFGDVSSLGAYSRFEKHTSNYARAMFRISGLTWWTEAGQAAAANVYARSLGTQISRRVGWNDLNTNYRAQLKRYGVTEDDWKLLLDKQPLNQDGLFDFSQLEDIEFATYEDRAFSIRMGQDNISNKFQAVMRDATDTMIIKPGAFDVLATALFPEDFAGAGSQIAKMLTQFKSHPITYYRKLISRKFLSKRLGEENFGRLEQITDLAILTSTMIAMGALVTQIKEVVAGNQPFRADSPQLWARAASTSGVYGILSDMILTFGGEDIIRQAVSDKAEPVRTTGEKFEQILGPIVTDIGKILDNLTRAGIGTLRSAKDIDDGEFFDKSLLNITKFLASSTGFKNLLWTKMLYRYAVNDYLTSWWDADLYEQQQSRLDRIAYDERIKGRTNLNIIDLSSQLTF